MRKPLTTVPQTSARFGHEGTRKPANSNLMAKSSLHNWWRIRGIRISSRNNGRIKNTTELVLYKILHYFVPDYLHFGCMVLENIISTKHYFQHK